MKEGFTTKQRLEIYELALKFMESDCDFMCEAIADAIEAKFNSTYLFAQILLLFPEFLEIKPKDAIIDLPWWDKEIKKVRIWMFQTIIERTKYKLKKELQNENKSN